jgi:hypothetical protein
MLTSFVCEIYSHGLGVGIGHLKVEWGLWLLYGSGARPPCWSGQDPLWILLFLDGRERTWRFFWVPTCVCNYIPNKIPNSVPNVSSMFYFIFFYILCQMFICCFHNSHVIEMGLSTSPITKNMFWSLGAPQPKAFPPSVFFLLYFWIKFSLICPLRSGKPFSWSNHKLRYFSTTHAMMFLERLTGCSFQLFTNMLLTVAQVCSAHSKAKVPLFLYCKQCCMVLSWAGKWRRPQMNHHTIW